MPRKTTPLSSLIVVLVMAVVALAGCAPTAATHGNFLDDERLQGVQVGVSTKAEVEQKLGAPSTTAPFDDNTWYYIGEKTETTSFYDPEIIERKVIIMTFNEDGFLQEASQLDETEGKKIEVVKKTTPAPGREVNAFEQFLGNLGKFNASDMQQRQPGR